MSEIYKLISDEIDEEQIRQILQNVGKRASQITHKNRENIL